MREKRSISVVGGSSLLVIFAVLCLTVFALLSISTVRADQRLGDRSEAAVLGYYEADCRAEEILAQLRAGELPEGVTRQEALSPLSSIPDTQSPVIEGPFFTDVQEEIVLIGGDIYSYACPISDTQVLAVEVMVEGEAYRILRWQAVSTTEWQADESLNVWDGEFE